MTETTTDKTKRRSWTITKFGKPALEQARDAVDLGHDHMCRVVSFGQVGDDVAERVAVDVVVSPPSPSRRPKESRMRSAVKFLVPALAASLALAACGSSSSKSGSSSQAAATPASTTSSSSGESAAVVRSASNTTLGATVLVDAQGMTLYRLSGEQNGKFTCTSSVCLGVWHPLSASSAATPSGSVGSLGTVKHPDGSEQVTYKGMPLYTFAQDQKPGDAGGQGIKDVGTWAAVTASP